MVTWPEFESARLFTVCFFWVFELVRAGLIHDHLVKTQLSGLPYNMQGTEWSQTPLAVKKKSPAFKSLKHGGIIKANVIIGPVFEVTCPFGDLQILKVPILRAK